jgi:hypothetical protein
MFNFSKDEQEIVQKDQQSNPGCNYSTNMSKTCRDENGEFVCETIRHLYRVCPGKKSVMIYNQTKQYSGSDTDKSQNQLELPSIFGGSSGMFDRGDSFNPFDLAEDIFSRFGFGFSIGDELNRRGGHENNSPHFPNERTNPIQDKSGWGIFSSGTGKEKPDPLPPVAMKPQITGPVEEI